MSEAESPSEKGGVSDGLRAAVERTLAATAGTAAETRGRAQELLDEVARRGIGARDEVARRGQRTREGLGRIRFATAEELEALGERLGQLELRLERLEVAARTSAAAESKSKVEG